MDELIAKNRDVITSIGKVQAAIDGLHDREVKVTLNEDEVLEQVAYIREVLGGLEDKTVTVAVKYVSEGKPEDVAAATTLTGNVNLGDANNAVNQLGASLDGLKQKEGDAAGEAGALAAAMIGASKGLGSAASTSKDASSAMDHLGAVAFAQVARMTLWGGAIHWIIAGGSELAATLIPAMYAAAAAAYVMMQGVNNVANHVQSLYTATEALGPMMNTTAGDMLGLGHSIQTAQNMANPKVYELFGEALQGIKTQSQVGADGLSNFGRVGLHVTQILDQFGAKIVVDMRHRGREINELLSGAVTDLTEFGQIFGNIGHALLNFAAGMPGLAEVLLKVIDMFSQLILWISKAPPWLIAVVMGFEEAYRWGGLLVGILSKLPWRSGGSAPSGCRSSGRSWSSSGRWPGWSGWVPPRSWRTWARSPPGSLISPHLQGRSSSPRRRPGPPWRMSARA